MPVTVSSPTVSNQTRPNRGGAIEIVHKGANASGSPVFPDVCKTPAPPAPFVPTPYPQSQYEENLRQANKADAAAKTGNKAAQAKVQVAIESAIEAGKGDEAGVLRDMVSFTTHGPTKNVSAVKVTSATQAVMIGWTLHKKHNGYQSRPKKS